MKTGFIDWTGETLHLYVIEKKGGGYNITDMYSATVEGGLKPSDLDALPAAGIENIFLSLPPDILTLREHTFPFSDKDKIRDTIGYELEGLLLGGVNDYAIDHIMIDTPDALSRVLAVCMEKSRLREIIRIFSSSGLDPKVITSLDLRLSKGNIEALLAGTQYDSGIRAAAAIEEFEAPLMNLRQDELSYTGDIERLRKTLRVTAALALLLVLILASVSALKLMAAKKDQAALTKSMLAVYQGVFPEDKKIIDADRQFKGNINTLKKKMEALGGVPVLDILDSIAGGKTSNITLHEFSADGKNVVLKGTAVTFEDVEALKNNLADVFRDVKVTDSGASGDKKINFTIIMQGKTA